MSVGTILFIVAALVALCVLALWVLWSMIRTFAPIANAIGVMASHQKAMIDVMVYGVRGANADLVNSVNRFRSFYGAVMVATLAVLAVIAGWAGLLIFAVGAVVMVLIARPRSVEGH